MTLPNDEAKNAPQASGGEFSGRYRPSLVKKYSVNPAGSGAVLPVSSRELANPGFQQGWKQREGQWNSGGPIADYIVTVPQRTFWENPQRVGRYYQAMKALPPGTPPPAWINQEELEQTYNYFKTVNGDKPWYMWERDLADDDPVRPVLQGFKVPDELFAVENKMPTIDGAGTKAPPTLDQIRATKGLPWWHYVAAEALMSGPGRVANAVLQPLVAGAATGAIAGGGAGAIPGAIVGGVLGIGAGIATGTMIEQERKTAEAAALGQTYTPTAFEQGSFNTLNALNFLYESANRAVGFGYQAANDFQGTMEDPALAWEAGKFTFANMFAGTIEGQPYGEKILRANIENAIKGDFLGKGLPNKVIVKITLGIAEPEIIPIPEGKTALDVMFDGYKNIVKQGGTTSDAEAWVRDTYGFGQDMRDLVAGYLLDPTDRIVPAITGTVHLGAKLSGNTPLAQATRSFEGVEAVKDYSQRLRQLPPDELAKYGGISRLLAGADETGNIKAYKPTTKGNFTGLLELDNKSRATEALHTTTDGLRMAFEGVKEPGEAMRILKQVARVTAHGASEAGDSQPLANWFNGAEAQIVPNAIRDQVPAAQEMLDNYEISRPQAQVIRNMADAMGVDPYKLMKDYREADSKGADTLFRQFVDKLTEMGQTDILKTLPGNLDGMGVKKMVSLFDGSNGAPFTGDEFITRLGEMLVVGADKWAAKWFNVQPQGWFYRATNLVKQAQGYVLLGFNPAYFWNNTIDNMIKLAYEGVLSANTPKSNTRFWKDFGFSPSRRGEGFGAGADVEFGNTNKSGQAIRKAQEAKGAIASASEFLRKGDKLQVMARLSGTMEKFSSDMAMTTAARNYWNRHWKPGVGFEHMPADLALAMEAYQPGLSAKIEAAIARGMNKAQIEKELFNNWQTPALRDVMPADDYATLSHFPEIAQGLEAELLKATTPQETQKAFAKARSTFQDRIGQELRGKYQHIAEVARQKATAEGMAGVLDVADEALIQYGNVWLQHFERAGDVAAAVEKAPNNTVRSALWQQFFAEEDRVFTQARNIHGYKWIGLFDGMGATNETSAQILWLLGGSEVGDPLKVGLPEGAENIHTIWGTFFNERRRMYGELSDLYQTGAKDAEIKAKRAEIDVKANELYIESVLAEDLAQTRMDKLFSDLYEKQVGGDSARAWRMRAQNIRRKMAAAQILWRSDRLPDNVLAAFGKDILPKKLVQDIANARLMKRADGAKAFHQEIYPRIIREWMDARNGPMKPAPAKPAPTPNTPKGKATAEQKAKADAAKAEAETAALAAQERTNWLRLTIQDGKYGAMEHLWNSLKKYLPDGATLEATPLAELKDAFTKRQAAKLAEAQTPQPEPVAQVDTTPDTAPIEAAPVQETVAAPIEEQTFDPSALIAQAETLKANAAEQEPTTLIRGRSAWEQDLTERLGEEQAAASMAVMDGFAQMYAKRYGVTPDDWYNNVILESGEGEVVGLDQRARGEYLDRAYIEVGGRYFYAASHSQAVSDAVKASAMRPRDTDYRMGFETSYGRKIDRNQAIADFGTGVSERMEIANRGLRLQDSLKQNAPTTPAFREWFGDSKVVDAEGKPLVVYHGTDRGYEFDAFARGIPNSQMQLGFGIHFAPDQSFVSDYYAAGTGRKGEVGTRVIPAYLKIENILDADKIYTPGTPEYKLATKLVPGIKKQAVYNDGLYLQNIIDMAGPRKAEKIIRESGYDGIKYKAIISSRANGEFINHYEATSYLVFDPEQIKSTFNSGTFDPNDPNILRQQAKGATYWNEQAQAVIHAYKAADLSTFSHEAVHAYTPHMGLEDATVLRNEYKAATGKDAPDDWYLTPTAHVDMSEWTARTFEKYLHDGPTAGMRYPIALQRVFAKFRDWLLKIYQTIKGSDIDVEVSPVVRGVYDRWMGGEVEAQPARDLTPAPTAEAAPAQVESAPNSLSSTLYKPDETPEGRVAFYQGELEKAQAKHDSFMAKKVKPDADPADLQRLETRRRNVVSNLEDAKKMLESAQELVDFNAKRAEAAEALALSKPALEPEPTPEPSVYEPSRVAIRAPLTRSEQFYLGKNIPRGIEQTVRELARTMRSEIEKGFNPPVYTRDIDTEAINGRSRSAGPVWYRDWYKSNPTVKVSQVRSALDRIILGRDQGKLDNQVRYVILNMLTNEEGFDLDAAWYYGARDKVFELAGDQIKAAIEDPNATDASLRKELGQYADEILDEYLLRKDDQGAGTYDELPILGEQTPGFELQAQKAEAQTFTPKEQGQESLFDRGPVKGIKAKKAVDTGKTNENMLFQSAPEEPMSVGMPRGTVDNINPMPIQEANYEGYLQHIAPMLDKAEAGMLTAKAEPRTALNLNTDLAPADMRKLKSYVGKVLTQKGDVAMGTIRHAESKRDAALLNYNSRIGFDNLAGTIFPYQFWYTHSLMNWALRALNKPAFFSNWARVRMLQEKYEREGYPTRLNGKIGIPAPFLPSWMGSTIYTDPLARIFSFEQMASPFATMNDQANKEQKGVTGIVNGWMDENSIPSLDGTEAIRTQQGAVWEKALAQYRNENEADVQNPADFMGLLFGYSLPVNYLLKALPGQNGKNRIDEIGLLPTTRLIKNLTAGMGMNDGMGVNIEAPVRKVFGMPEGERFEDYYLDRELVNMVADGLIDSKTAQQAMIDRTGPVFAQAKERVGDFQQLKFWGAPLAADIFPEGEKEMRALGKEYAAAGKAQYEDGVKGAMSKFFDEHPEYESRLSLWKDPNERMRQFLISSIWEGWNGASKVERRAASEQLGDTFNQAFINKETRSYDSIDIETLSHWSRMLKARTPETAPATPQGTLDLPNEQIQGAVDGYYSTIEERFPNIYGVQTMYYGLQPGAQRKSFLAKYPQLKEYWDWKKEYVRTYPETIPYIPSEETVDNAYLNSIGGAKATPQEMAEVTGPLVSALSQYWINGTQLSPGAEREVKRILKLSGRGMDYTAYLAFLKGALQ